MKSDFILFVLLVDSGSDLSDGLMSFYFLNRIVMRVLSMDNFDSTGCVLRQVKYNIIVKNIDFSDDLSWESFIQVKP
jgi:hypothetical protein